MGGVAGADRRGGCRASAELTTNTVFVMPLSWGPASFAHVLSCNFSMQLFSAVTLNVPSDFLVYFIISHPPSTVDMCQESAFAGSETQLTEHYFLTVDSTRTIRDRILCHRPNPDVPEVCPHAFVSISQSLRNRDARQLALPSCSKYSVVHIPVAGACLCRSFSCTG